MSAPVIGIVGSGKIGEDVARLATAGGLPVVLANSRGPRSLGELITVLGPTASADTVTRAIERAEIVVLALPFGAYDTLPAVALAGKIVVDATNYYPERDGQVPALEAGDTTSSEMLSSRFPNARVVKALNTVDFIRLPRLARAPGAPDRTALPVAGDSSSAKARTVELLDAIGFDALDLGALSEGWRAQPGTPIFVTPYWRPAEPPADDPSRRFASGVPVPVPLEQARQLARAAGV